MTTDAFGEYSDRERYDGALARALSVSGESKEYFARGRIETTRAYLENGGAGLRARGGAAALGGAGLRARDGGAELGGAGLRARGGALRVLDFGCGIGDSAPLLRDILGASDVVGVDPSASSIEHGRKLHAQEAHVSLVTSAEFTPDATFDVVYTNGVFHHIPIGERATAAHTIRAALKSGGRVFLWENHAGNPGTRFVMARCEFDDDAIPIWPHRARKILEGAGLVVEKTLYRFLFPRSLAFLRPLESRLLRVAPIGAQYVVIARKP